jgi:poly(A) polymerase
MREPNPSPTDHSPLLDRLAPPQRAVAARLAEHFAEAGEELYLVGGIVRDLLLGREAPADLDFATSASPETAQRLAKAAGADSIYLVGERFGTVGAVFGTEPDRTLVEITTYRREHYPDATRFPVVRFGASLADDLSRRDFTINAIAADAQSGEIVDPFGGEADLALGVVRAVGDADERFAEDPLRLFRAARFVAQLGFRLDWETEAAMRRRAADLRRISRERIYAEMTKLLVGPYADSGLDALRRAGVLVEAVPELEPLAEEADLDLRDRLNREKDLWDHTLRVVRQTPPLPVVRWAALLHDAAKPLTREVDRFGDVHFFGHERLGADRAANALRRLKADKATIAAVETLVALHGRPAAYEPDWTDSAVRRLALDAGDAWDDLLALAAADVTSRREAKVEQATARVAALRERFARLQAEAELSRLKSPLDGDELMAMFDRGPGPWIKEIKNRLTDLVIDGALAPDDKATAARIAREMLDDESAT